jgi:hypothetical protein
LSLNPVDPSLPKPPDLKINGFRGRAARTARDEEILCRRWLLVDIDPARPSRACATGGEVRRSSIGGIFFVKPFPLKGVHPQKMPLDLQFPPARYVRLGPEA